MTDGDVIEGNKNGLGGCLDEDHFDLELSLHTTNKREIPLEMIFMK